MTPEQFEAGRDLLGKLTELANKHNGEGWMVLSVSSEGIQKIARAFKYLADQRDAARAQVSQLISQRDVLNAKRGKAQAEAEQLKAQLGQAQRDAEDFRKERNDANAQMLRIAGEAKAFRDELTEARRRHASWACDAALAQGRLTDQLVASQVEVSRLRDCVDKSLATISGLLEQRDRATALAEEACGQRDEIKAAFEDLVEVLVDESAPSVVVLQLGERVFG